MQLADFISTTKIRAARRACLLLATVICLGSSAAVSAQDLIIKREPISLINPSRYQMPLVLQATQSIDIAASADGTVLLINVQPGQTIQSQTELLRLDSTRQGYILNKAKAAMKAAQLRAESLANSSDTQARNLAAASLEVAKAEFAVAEFDMQQLNLRAPIDGTVFRLLVQPGQFVKAGEPLMEMGNTQKLMVLIPVDRNTTKVGSNIEIAIESTKVNGVVQAILPLTREQGPLRDLVESAATAEVVFDNPQNKLTPGQSVYSPLVPRHPVVEIPNAVLSNLPEGGRKIQVLRDNVVTDIPVTVLGPIGPDRSFVSGPLAAEDFLIISSTAPLSNGTVVRAASQPAPAPVAPTNPSIPVLLD